MMVKSLNMKGCLWLYKIGIIILVIGKKNEWLFKVGVFML